MTTCQQCGRSTADSLRNNDVVITSKRRHFDVITSKWRRFDVITTLLHRVFRGNERGEAATQSLPAILTVGQRKNELTLFRSKSQFNEKAKRMTTCQQCGRSTADSLRNNDVVITSKRRHFDVITSKWRRFDVITTLLHRVFRGNERGEAATQSLPAILTVGQRKNELTLFRSKSQFNEIL